jgi:hypothetical protein
MPTDPQLDTQSEGSRATLPLMFSKPKPIEQWIAETFPPARKVAVTIALLQIAIETQLTITDDEEHLLRRIHCIFAEAREKRRGRMH